MSSAARSLAMKFSIITPSFRSSEWLKLCIASIADQEVEHEHIVQDSCSDDETPAWLSQDRRVKAFIEKDNGMYNGINRGLRRASGDILGFLNCDEQYLPGALANVEQYFQNNPEIEVACAEAIVVDPAGNYLCHRQACVPQRYHTLVSGNLSILTCATFCRRSLITRHGLFFDDSFKNVGDAEWVSRLLDCRSKFGLLKVFTSAFTDTGENLSLQSSGMLERVRLRALAPAWVRSLAPAFVVHHRLRRLLAGHYRRKRAFDYAIYTHGSPQSRVTKRASKPTFRWVRA
jgi:glycosyltransferase involved in cell wall biosynthesis